MVQREGRIIRQGNENSKVKIFRYITEGSFDAYSWQLLETKQRFISGLLSGTLMERSGTDVVDTVLDYAEVKALAVGNPLIKERVEAANELTRFMTLQRKLIETRTALEKELLELPGKQQYQKMLIEKCVVDVETYEKWKVLHPTVEDSKGKKEEAVVRKTLREQINSRVAENVLQEKETFMMEHCGFRVILPANMMPEKPYVWVEGCGRYSVELGDTEVGNLIRIENFLGGLSKHCEKLKVGLNKMEEREQAIQAELAQKECYTDCIDECKKKLDALDKKLGVDKK